MYVYINYNSKHYKYTVDVSCKSCNTNYTQYHYAQIISRKLKKTQCILTISNAF